MYTEAQLQDIVVHILEKSITRKMGLNVIFETTNEEDAFFKELVKQSYEVKLNPLMFYFEPMSNKSFSVWYNSYPIGKIKLRGNKTYIQIFKGLSGVKEENYLSLEEYISHIPEWIKHIKYCLRN